LITNPFPSEFREGAILMTTGALLAGKNPYDLALQPEYTNVYGIFYHWIVWPWAKLFGNTLPVHRAVTGVFIALSCGLMLRLLRRLRVPLLLSCGTTLIFYAHLIFYVTPLARPDGLGVFLLLLTVLIPFEHRFSRRSLLGALLCGILALLTKPYFMFGLVIVIAYLILCRSKTLGLAYGILSALAIGLTLVVMNAGFETYVNNTFLVHVNAVKHGADFADRQLLTYATVNLGWMALLGIAGLFQLVQMVRRQGRQAAQPWRLTDWRLTDWQAPLLPWTVDFFLFGLVASSLFFSYSLGQHRGNWLVYIHHLISPFLLILTAVLARDLYRRGLGLKVMVAGLIGITLLNLSSPQFLPDRPQYYVQAWQSIQNLTGRYESIFSSSSVTPLLIGQGKRIYDSGQSEYFIKGAQRQTAGASGLLQQWPVDAKIVARNNEFLTGIEQDVRAQKYQLVILAHDMSNILDVDFLAQYYDYSGQLTAPTRPIPLLQARNWRLDVWKPKPIGHILP
jgi:hypothetical protein